MYIIKDHITESFICNITNLSYSPIIQSPVCLACGNYYIDVIASNRAGQSKSSKLRLSNTGES